ncbi:F-box family protein with DUF295 [Prunus dulcis]|uniref:F-box family protein with DUF295 n=1 Tax=Prunus dulcis TaxID=3755 RepID=A0A4Y1QXP1_PRUDU|nr:F-box family protein with DUF295 [Prunus dulcis]
MSDSTDCESESRILRNREPWARVWILSDNAILTNPTSVSDQIPEHGSFSMRTFREAQIPSETVDPRGPGSAGLVFIDLLFMDNQAPEVQSTRRRDLRRNHHVPTLYLVITQSWTDVYGHPVRFQFTFSALDFASRVTGRSDRECQDLRLGRLGVPRPARIAARLTLCPRDLPGLRIRLTTVPCILPERLESTWCHRDLPADQADHSPLISPVCGSGRLRRPRPARELTDMTGVQIGVIRAVEVRRIHHRAIPSFRATKGDSAEFSAEV